MKQLLFTHMCHCDQTRINSIFFRISVLEGCPGKVGGARFQLGMTKAPFTPNASRDADVRGVTLV